MEYDAKTGRQQNNSLLEISDVYTQVGCVLLCNSGGFKGGR